MNSTYTETINANGGTDNTGNAFISRYAAAGGMDYFPGSISEVSIWNRALTEAELRAVSRN